MSVTAATELWRMSALELAEAIRCRRASSREVVEAHLRRVEAVNASVNAVAVVLGEQALEAAGAGRGAGPTDPSVTNSDARAPGTRRARWTSHPGRPPKDRFKRCLI